MTHSKVVNWDWLKAKRNLWWYPQDEASNNAIHNALHLVAPRSPVYFVRASLRVMPAMIRKMYF